MKYWQVKYLNLMIRSMTISERLSNHSPDRHVNLHQCEAKQVKNVEAPKLAAV